MKITHSPRNLNCCVTMGANIDLLLRRTRSGAEQFVCLYLKHLHSKYYFQRLEEEEERQ